MKFKTLTSTLAISLVGIGSMGFAAGNQTPKPQAPCKPTQPAAPCYSIDDRPECAICLGPENVAGNPAVRPRTCNGDYVLDLAVFLWNSRQDGMEYAIDDSVTIPQITTLPSSNLNFLLKAKFLNPKSKWNFGFKLGAGYNSNYDGWDIHALWTRFRNRSSTHVEAEFDDNHALLPLWSAFASSAAGPVLYATDIETHRRLKLDLVDLEIGREFWTSQYVTLRPHFGLRFCWIKQEYEIDHKGGSWGTVSSPAAGATNGIVDMDNDFKGVGLRGGLDTSCYVGRGFTFFGNLALSIVYGRFSIEQDERNFLAAPSFASSPILEIKETFHASRGMTDLALGVEWSTLFNDCYYRFTLALAWEHHMFFNQNQLWRINRIVTGTSPTVQPNTNGQNAFAQSRGDLSTQGWTLSATFDF